MCGICYIVLYISMSRKVVSCLLNIFYIEKSVAFALLQNFCYKYLYDIEKKLFFFGCLLNFRIFAREYFSCEEK